MLTPDYCAQANASWQTRVRRGYYTVGRYKYLVSLNETIKNIRFGTLYNKLPLIIWLWSRMYDGFGNRILAS
ncbi:hypothetical protein GCM10027443_26520 [Pontibacter brevis]